MSAVRSEEKLNFEVHVLVRARSVVGLVLVQTVGMAPFSCAYGTLTVRYAFMLRYLLSVPLCMIIGGFLYRVFSELCTMPLYTIILISMVTKLKCIK